MRILLRVGTAEYVLAHGHERGVDLHMGPLFQSHGSPIAVQSKQTLRASYGELIQRGNIIDTIDFSIEVEKASREVAELYYVDYPQSLPRAGKIRFEMADALGVKTLREITAGVISNVRMGALEGVSMTITYTVGGGQIGNVTAD
jgi:hypothetical protein